jgi:hypothetical protein
VVSQRLLPDVGCGAPMTTRSKVAETDAQIQALRHHMFDECVAIVLQPRHHPARAGPPRDAGPLASGVAAGYARRGRGRGAARE